MALNREHQEFLAKKEKEEQVEGVGRRLQGGSRRIAARIGRRRRDEAGDSS